MSRLNFIADETAEPALHVVIEALLLSRVIVDIFANQGNLTVDADVHAGMATVVVVVVLVVVGL